MQAPHNSLHRGVQVGALCYQHLDKLHVALQNSKSKRRLRNTLGRVTVGGGRGEVGGSNISSRLARAVTPSRTNTTLQHSRLRCIDVSTSFDEQSSNVGFAFIESKAKKRSGDGSRSDVKGQQGGGKSKSVRTASSQAAANASAATLTFERSSDRRPLLSASGQAPCRLAEQQEQEAAWQYLGPCYCRRRTG